MSASDTIGKTWMRIADAAAAIESRLRWCLPIPEICAVLLAERRVEPRPRT
jgi:hypothetical protein